MKVSPYRVVIGLMLWLLPAALSAADVDVVEVAEPSAGAAGQVIVGGSWGTAPGTFGKVDEASRPGPMDFAVQGDSLHVLDPVNRRVQVFGLDGTLERVIDIGTATADFIAVGDDGRIAVLDAFNDRELRVFAPEGALLATARLPAALRLPSAVFVQEDQFLVEERHSRVHALRIESGRHGAAARLVGTQSGRPRAEQAGTMHAAKRGAREVVLGQSEGDGAQQQHRVRFPRPIRSIVALESDGAGHTYLAAACWQAPDEHRVADLVVAKLTTAGEVAGTLTVPDQYVTDHYRKLLVTPEGDVVQMQTDEAGVRFVRWALPAPGQEGGAR